LHSSSFFFRSPTVLGQENCFFAANGARFGFAATMPSNIGYHIATWLVTVVIGLGMIAALNDYPNVLLALKMSGAAYVYCSLRN
jgi:threonine/homoserine/homoserine lactone efflux protein